MNRSCIILYQPADGQIQLDEKNNVQNPHIAGSDKPARFYNINAIILVGERRT
jgi:hypothetical protein